MYKKARKLFDNIIERDRTGQCPMYRGKFSKEEKEKRKHSISSVSGIQEEIIKRSSL